MLHVVKHWTKSRSRDSELRSEQSYSADPLALEKDIETTRIAPRKDCEKRDGFRIALTEFFPAKPKFTDILYRPGQWLDQKLGPHYAGWRFGVIHYAIWASIVFLINAVVTIWGSASEGGILVEGDCSRIKTLNTVLHVIINVLSTILLGGSNYCMQALSAPTRAEINKVHASGEKWLDIGIPSVRNLRYISRRRLFLWAMLGLSSLPLHLFYNSAVFSTINSNDYGVFAVSEAYLENPNPSQDLDTSFQSQALGPVLEMMREKARTKSLQKLTPADCLNEYAIVVNSKRLSVFLVANDELRPPAGAQELNYDSMPYWSELWSGTSAGSSSAAFDAYRWICSGEKDIVDFTGSCSDRLDSVRSRLPEWRVSGPYVTTSNGTVFNDSSSMSIKYCLSELGEQHCTLQFQTAIAVSITMLNFLKAALMFYIAFAVSEDPLVTIGDAVASFLNERDPGTQHLSIASSKDFTKHRHEAPRPRQWHNKRYRWRDTTSIARQIVVIALFVIALGIVSSLLSWGLRSLPEGFNITSLEYGAVDPRTAVTGMPNDLLINAVVSNSPQLILSLLYFSYNALVTAMLMGYEWTTYAFKRKGLRVSHFPTGAQRSTYFLELPYRFSLPLMIVSGTLHWLVSESIFVLAIDFYNVYGQPGGTYGYGEYDPGYKTLGFSPIAIVSVIVLGGVMVIALVAVGFVPYRKGMPLAGTCSRAISAACHGPEDKEGEVCTAERKVQWGVVSVDKDGVGHCAFSAGHVEPLVEGRWCR